MVASRGEQMEVKIEAEKLDRKDAVEKAV